MAANPEISPEDDLRLNLMLAQKPEAVRINESRLVAGGRQLANRCGNNKLKRTCTGYFSVLFLKSDSILSLQFHVYLHLSILYYACAYLMTLSCPGGETGRRKGLK
jgi:hypothetical protein